MALIHHVTNALPSWLPLPGQTTIPGDANAIAGGFRLFSMLLAVSVAVLAPAFVFFGVYFLLRMALRRPAVAAVALAVVASVVSLGGENVLLETPGAVAIGVLWAVVIARFGLLAAVAFQLMRELLVRTPLLLDFGSAHATSTGIFLLLIVALLLYAFRVSLGPRPMFNLALDD